MLMSILIKKTNVKKKIYHVKKTRIKIKEIQI